MDTTPNRPPVLHKPTIGDLGASLAAGWRDFLSAPVYGLFFASVYVIVGLVMYVITLRTGHTFWLILAVLGFPLVGAFAALGIYEISRRRVEGIPIRLAEILRLVWSHKNGQLPWLAVLVVVLFLFWFFLGHMIFALFLGLAPMTNISSSLDVFWTSDGLMMLAFGTTVGAIFAMLVFSMCVLALPMILDREIDFVTAMVSSIFAVRSAPAVYLAWGALIGTTTILAMLPYFLGLFIAMPVFGHATWHLYKRVSS